MNPDLTVKVDDRLLAKPGRTRTAIHDPELKRLRAAQMMQARVAGNSIHKVAEMFQVSEDTVQRTLTYAKRAGILVEAADAILERMVPLAQTAIIEALKADDDEVDKLSKANLGMKLFEGTGLLGNKGKPSGAHSDDDELTKAMHSLREKAQLLADTSEGELIEPGSPQRLLPDVAGSRAAEAVEGDVQVSPALPTNPAADRLHLDREAAQASAAENVSADDLRRPAESKLS